MTGSTPASTSAAPPPGRRRDAARSRARLLGAAVELFAAKGFDATSVREISARAGVDAALIARYFGNKTGLYVAAMRAELGDTAPADLGTAGRPLELLERVRQRGAGPVYRSAVLAQDNPDIAEIVGTLLHTRLVDPLVSRFQAEGLERAQIRAEMTVAAFTGIVLARGAGLLATLAEASDQEIANLVEQLIAALKTGAAAQ